MKRWKLDVVFALGFVVTCSGIGMAQAIISEDAIRDFFVHHKAFSAYLKDDTSNVRSAIPPRMLFEVMAANNSEDALRFLRFTIGISNDAASDQELRNAAKEARAMWVTFYGNEPASAMPEPEQKISRAVASVGHNVARLEENLADASGLGFADVSNGTLATNAAPTSSADPQANDGKNPPTAKEHRYVPYGIGITQNIHPNGRTFYFKGRGIPHTKFKVPAPWFFQFDVPGLSKVRAGRSLTVLKSQVIQDDGLGSQLIDRIVDEFPGWRGFEVLGFGLEQPIKRFVLFTQVNLGWSKNSDQELIEEQWVQTSPLFPDQVVKSKVLERGPGANSLSFYSTANLGLGFNIRPWFQVNGGYTRILAGGPTNKTQDLAGAPGVTATQHQARNGGFVGIKFIFDQPRN